MNCPALRRSILVLSLAAPALSAGCDRHLASGKPAAIATSTPEERFQHVLDSFRRKIEGQPVGFVVAEGGVRTTAMGTNTVTSELIRPENADGHFKAVITVTSQSRYSLRRTKSGDESEHEKNAQNQGADSLADPKEKQGIGILEPDLASSPRNETSPSAAKTTHPAEDIVTRRRHDDIRKYELEDDDGRWVLITKPDPKTEQAIEFAFTEALARQ